MAVSALGFCTMAVFVKRLAPAIPQFELVFFRSLINLLFVLGWIFWRENGVRAIQPSWILFGRGVAGFFGITCLFYSVSHLPLPVAMLLSWSSPLFVLIFSRILLKERVGARSLVWIAGVFLGLDLLLGRLEPASAEPHAPIGWVPVLIGLFGACCAGLAYVAVRAASQRKVSNAAIVFYLTAVATAFSFPFAVRNFVQPSSQEFLELIALGLFATVGQVFMTQAYRYARAGIVSTMGLLNAALSAVFGWWLFGETLHLGQWAGLTLMALSLAFLTLRR